jgi:hypothetical protein
MNIHGKYPWGAVPFQQILWSQPKGEGFVFLTEELSQSSPEFDDTEKIDIKILPFKKAYEMVLENKITDSISIAGILKLGKMLDL